MVCHQSSTTSTRVSSPLVQTIKHGDCVECPTGRGRLANQRAAPSAHVGAVNDEARPRRGSSPSRTLLRSSRFRMYSRPLRAFQWSFNDRYTASFELLDLTVHDMSDSLANCPLTEKELHQLRIDEEALKEMLEEEAMEKRHKRRKLGKNKPKIMHSF
ncbi:hypothetical protein Tco_0356540 [Tanacetum coccineum]